MVKRLRISAWKRGDNIPSSQSVQLLENWSTNPSFENINWIRVKALLLIARAIDSTKRKTAGLQLIEATRFFLRNRIKTYKTLITNINKIQEQHIKSLLHDLPEFYYIFDKMRLKTTKTENDKKKLYSSIHILRKYLSDNNQTGAIGYWLNWQEARWHVLSGNVKKSCELYKNAFEGCLYKSGDMQKTIIEEAMVVAATLKNPDKAFLKHLKNALITFKYEVPSAIRTSKSFKTSNIIEDWEFNLWKANFQSIFPKDGLFPNTKYKDTVSRKGVLLVSNHDSIQPDYRSPDRKIKISDTWKKSMPQIIYFAKIGDINAVERY